jgi:hypothetical protein
VEEEIVGGHVRNTTTEGATHVVLAVGAAPAEPSYSTNCPSLYRRASQLSCGTGAATADFFPRSVS